MPAMKHAVPTLVALALATLVQPVSASDDAAITRMALCRDSWIEWTKTDPKTFEAFRGHVTSLFAPHGNDPYWLPKAKTKVSVVGLNVSQLFPQSVGMGVGFSLTVDAPFDVAREAAKKVLGKTPEHCESSDGIKSCETAIGHQRTFMLMAENGRKSRETLIGCYYFYEK